MLQHLIAPHLRICETKHCFVWNSMCYQLEQFDWVVGTMKLRSRICTLHTHGCHDPMWIVCPSQPAQNTTNICTIICRPWFPFIMNTRYLGVECTMCVMPMSRYSGRYSQHPKCLIAGASLEHWVDILIKNKKRTGGQLLYSFFSR